MSRISEIIDKYVGKFNQSWFKQKKKEFESSDLFNLQTNSIKINNVSIYGEIFDDDDKECDFSLLEYCVLDPRDYENFNIYIKDSIRIPIKNLPILEEEAFKLSEELLPKIEEAEIKHCNETLQHILAQIEDSCNLMNLEGDKVYSLLLNEFHSNVRLNLNCKYPLFQTVKTVDIGLLSTFSFHSTGVKFPKDS